MRDTGQELQIRDCPGRSGTLGTYDVPVNITCSVVVASLLVQWYTVYVPGSWVCWHVLWCCISTSCSHFYCSQTTVLILSLCFPMINLVYSCVASWRVIRGYCRLALAVLCTYSNISTFIWASSSGNGRNKNEIRLILRNEVRWCMICKCMWHTDVREVGLTYGKKNDRILREGEATVPFSWWGSSVLVVKYRDPHSLFIGSGCWLMCYDLRISLE